MNVIDDETLLLVKHALKHLMPAIRFCGLYEEIKTDPIKSNCMTKKMFFNGGQML